MFIFDDVLSVEYIPLLRSELNRVKMRTVGFRGSHLRGGGKNIWEENEYKEAECGLEVGGEKKNQHLFFLFFQSRYV